MSVITSRALPDVRDGLKPVQRRILFTMGRDLRLSPTSRYMKCARVVGQVMGAYHPHGDQAIYDALVRLAQPFSLREPLVDGQGNFGSLDADGAAAMRYTEARLTPLAMELLEELGADTVPLRPNYDGTREEPVVLPARFPNLLLNGAQGIAVGMATSIPPHNLGELLRACVRLIDDPERSTAELLRTVKGPDLPTGGELLASREALREAYQTGRGSFKVRGSYRVEREGRRSRIVIDSIPYGVTKSAIVEKIGEQIAARRVPQALDVRDESTDEVRVVIDLKAGAEPAPVMAYLYRHTPLETHLHLNLTCLVPTADPAVTRPERLGLKAALEQFLAFRLEVVTRRLAHRLRKLEQRIHILEGFAIIFDALDEALRIVRRSEGRADAHRKLRKRFGLSEAQTDAVLDRRIYQLAALEIRKVLEELAEKRAEADEVRALLASEPARWRLIRDELEQLGARHATPRRTRVRTSEDDTHVYDAEAFIAHEDTHVVLTRDGWIKRVGRLRSARSTRTREGDAVAWVLPGSTRATVALFSNLGVAYVLRIHDVPATHGYGEPLGKLVRLRDGERIVGALSLDPRLTPADEPSGDDAPPRPWLLAATTAGQVLRFPLTTHREPSQRTGRRYCRLPAGEEVVRVLLPDEAQRFVALATEGGRVIAFALDEVNVLSGPGKGVRGIRLEPGDRVVWLATSRGHGDPVRLQTAGGAVREFPVTDRSVTARGGKGRHLVRRDRIVGPPEAEIEIPRLAREGEDEAAEPDSGEGSHGE
ncbi:MAG: DNA topoisomerase 4 subunit A [Planctomycetota bacterium]|nr:MAG: DNA topoisomerase 4 subunit A [Planctomycetota bacterium]